MESKNKTVLMAIIDSILEHTTWVNALGEDVSLKDSLGKSTTGRIEDLAKDDLVGAYTSFQVKKQSFSKNPKEMDTKDLSNEIKIFIFEETKAQMLMLERELNVEASKNIRKTA